MKRLLPLLLMGCGGASPSHDAPLRLQIESVAGSAYVAGCLPGAPDELVAARPWRLERWLVPIDGTPKLTARVEVGRPGADPPIVSLGCEGERVTVAREGGAVGVQGGAILWRGVAPAGWPPAIPHAVEGPHRWRAVLQDGRETALGDWGRGTLRGGSFLEWRPAAGDLADAAFDGKVVWAVGAAGLWRWTPGPGEPVAVPLPEGLAGRPLVGVFRDGPYLQVRTADGEGWALDTRGPVAKAAADPSRMAAPPETPQRAPAGPVYVESALGSSRLRVIRRDDERLLVVLDTPGPVHALLPLERVLLVATGDEVRAMRFDDDDEARVLASVHLGAPTLRMFVHGDRVLLVGRRYGFAVLRITPSS